jgi:DNA-binding NarL/FixJ family response regulator
MLSERLGSLETEQIPGKEVARVFIVDDHPWVRLGLVKMLEHEAGFSVCGEAEEAEGAMKRIAETAPDVAIVDISLKGSVDGIELTRMLKREHPNLPVVILSMHAESEYAAHALSSGASGYVVKSEATDTLTETLRKVLDGGTYLSQEMQREIQQIKPQN